MTDDEIQNLPPAARMRALSEKLDEKMAELRQATRETREQTEQAQRQHRPMREEDWRQLAANARSGRAGPELQRVQQRIDRGEFTWEDVFAGRAPDDAVEALRQTAAPVRTIAAAAEEAADEDMTPEEFLKRNRINLNLPSGFRRQ